jgi:hypothetical protein
MRPIIAKFALFGESDNVIPILTKFRHNFGRVKVRKLPVLESYTERLNKLAYIRLFRTRP